MTRRFLTALCVACLTVAALGDERKVSDPQVVKAIRLVEDGEFDDAIVLLDVALLRLGKGPKSEDLTQAYLYLGVAYLGKGHESAAKARFREALAQVSDLKLSSDKFAPKVVAIFEQARAEAEKTEPHPLATAEAKKKGRSKAPLLLLGAGGAAAAVGIAAAGGSSPAARPTCASGQFAVSNARFDTPQFDCTGRSNQAYDLNYLFDTTNSSQVSVSITSVTSRFAVVGQTGAGNCISFDDGQLPFSPLEIPTGAEKTVTVFRGGRCGNDPPGRGGKLRVDRDADHRDVMRQFHAADPESAPAVLPIASHFRPRRRLRRHHERGTELPTPATPPPNMREGRSAYNCEFSQWYPSAGKGGFCWRRRFSARP